MSCSSFSSRPPFLWQESNTKRLLTRWGTIYDSQWSCIIITERCYEYQITNGDFTYGVASQCSYVIPEASIAHNLGKVGIRESNIQCNYRQSRSSSSLSARNSESWSERSWNASRSVDMSLRQVRVVKVLNDIPLSSESLSEKECQSESDSSSG